MISIRITSPPVLRPKARLAIAVRVQMPERIPKITLDILFRKMPIHWINTIGRSNGNLYVFDAVAGQWLTTTFANQALARAGAQAVPTPLGVYYIGGELKPALRTPQIVIIEN